MAHEIETTVLDIDAEDVIKKLQDLGAKKVQDTRLVVDWYRPKDWHRPEGVKEGEDPWCLRIRSNSEGMHEVTWKEKSVLLVDDLLTSGTTASEAARILKNAGARRVGVLTLALAP